MSWVNVRVIGRVQGVGYRAWTEREAAKRGLGGWVRNRRDGTVEAEFDGPAEIVADMVMACRQGPPAADVSEVIVADMDDQGVTPFRIRPTA